MSEVESVPMVPKPGFSGFGENFLANLKSGFLVFLIALPLCLAISVASGFPAVAGLFTAIIGGLVAPWISNSELTIKGPAAGLIVIVIGCVGEFASLLPEFEFKNAPEQQWIDAPESETAENSPQKVLNPNYEKYMRAYRQTLGIAVVAGIIQIVFGLARAGILGEIFPLAAVHGMLSAIGVIIMSKQIHVVLGVKAHAKEPLELLAEIPQSIQHMNPQIALIGLANLVLMFLWPLIKSPGIKKIPAQLVVILLAVPMARYFDLEHAHTYLWGGHEYKIDPGRMLVNVPMSVGELIAAFTFPDFSMVGTGTGLKWIILFSLIGTLESLLSAKAVDLLDPWKRKSNLNGDLLAVGIGNTLAACVGGLPMISEIVRSKANIDNGARSRFANMFHALFLAICLVTIPFALHQIPQAALAAMLVFTGFRLASPREFAHMYHKGPEQLLIFVTTLLTVLLTDLLIGVAAGVFLKFLIHLFNGAPFLGMFLSRVQIEDRDAENLTVVHVQDAAVFSNWLWIRKELLAIPESRNVELNLENTRLVDHTVMEKLHELQADFSLQKRSLLLTGLDNHKPLSSHPLAARKNR